MTTHTMIIRPLLLVLFSILGGYAFTGCMPILPDLPALGPKTYKVKTDISTGSFQRTYLVHIPSSYDGTSLLPLVVVVHGAFDTAKSIEETSGFSELADREQFVVMYPNGIGIFGFLQHWNAGHCCGKAAADEIDDVGFVAEAIEDLCDRLKIDRSRVYMTGFSNGGMFTYRFAAERGDLLAAAAPLAASIGGRASANEPEWRIPTLKRPVPLMVIHGLADDDVPYLGGRSEHRGGERTYLSVDESINYWVNGNGCQASIETEALFQGQVQFKRWFDCDEHADILFYLIKDWGHVWPGTYFTRSLEEGHPLRKFDACDIVWDFFKSHRRTR